MILPLAISAPSIPAKLGSDSAHRGRAWDYRTFRRGNDPRAEHAGPDYGILGVELGLPGVGSDRACRTRRFTSPPVNVPRAMRAFATRTPARRISSDGNSFTVARYKSLSFVSKVSLVALVPRRNDIMATAAS